MWVWSTVADDVGRIVGIVGACAKLQKIAAPVLIGDVFGQGPHGDAGLRADVADAAAIRKRIVGEHPGGVRNVQKIPNLLT